MNLLLLKNHLFVACDRPMILECEQTHVSVALNVHTPTYIQAYYCICTLH